MTARVGRIIAALFAVLAAPAWTESAWAEPTALGVLEDRPGATDNSRALRLAFWNDGTTWRAFSDCGGACADARETTFAATTNWTIGFDGDDLGEVTTYAPIATWTGYEAGRQLVRGQAPSIGDRNTDYAGYMGRPILRPLIANALPRVRDPERWHRAPPSGVTRAALRRHFRAENRNVQNCAAPGSPLAPWSYADGAIEILKTYQSARGAELWQVQLRGYLCDGPAPPVFLDQWYLLTPRGAAANLGYGMELVDAGDYDNDGVSELIFAIGRYNRGGYQLFTSDLSQRATFEFSFH